MVKKTIPCVEVIKAFFEDMTSELRPALGWILAEETAGAKVLWSEQGLSVLGRAIKLVWLEPSERLKYSWRDRQEPGLVNHGEGFGF